VVQTPSGIALYGFKVQEDSLEVDKRRDLAVGPGTRIIKVEQSMAFISDGEHVTVQPLENEAASDQSVLAKAGG
jgi:hypothetical protein